MSIKHNDGFVIIRNNIGASTTHVGRRQCTTSYFNIIIIVIIIVVIVVIVVRMTRHNVSRYKGCLHCFRTRSRPSLSKK